MYHSIPNPPNPNDVVGVNYQDLLACDLPATEHEIMVDMGLTAPFDFGRNVATAHDQLDQDWSEEANEPIDDIEEERMEYAD